MVDFITKFISSINFYFFFGKGVFKPTFYLPTAFLQVVYGAKLDPLPFIPFERELVDLPDKGVVALGENNEKYKTYK